MPANGIEKGCPRRKMMGGGTENRERREPLIDRGATYSLSEASYISRLL
jgi:hypothetical protein